MSYYKLKVKIEDNYLVVGGDKHTIRHGAVNLDDLISKLVDADVSLKRTFENHYDVYVAGRWRREIQTHKAKALGLNILSSGMIDISNLDAQKLAEVLDQLFRSLGNMGGYWYEVDLNT